MILIYKYLNSNTFIWMARKKNFQYFNILIFKYFKVCISPYIKFKNLYFLIRNINYLPFDKTAKKFLLMQKSSCNFINNKILIL